MTCVCFAEPSSLGVTEPFLTQKTAFLLKVSEKRLRKTVDVLTIHKQDVSKHVSTILVHVADTISMLISDTKFLKYVYINISCIDLMVIGCKRD
jgi:hypothetical protein